MNTMNRLLNLKCVSTKMFSTFETLTFQKRCREEYCVLSFPCMALCLLLKNALKEQFAMYFLEKQLNLK